ncbi:uncharacterized protein [Temnothorax nylanderi]|uniref:uncharacterized protein n=1 Tax=Temnothorax nylanderi TaxID=102681 RepID=UPI003A83A8A5
MNVTYKQREILLDSLKQHPEIIRGRVSRKSESRKELKDIWEQITNKLNSSGEGPVKTVQEWIKSWSDWKMYVLKKETNRRRNVQGTGGGPPKIVNFTDLEEQLLEILTPEAAGLANIPQAGFKSKKGTEIPHPEVPEVLEVPERSVQNEIIDDFDVLDIDKVPIIYCDDDLGNSTTRTQSGCTFEEDDDKENVNCELKIKNERQDYYRTHFLKSSTAAIHLVQLPAAVITDLQNMDHQIKRSEISHLMLRVQEETLELNRQELQLRKDALKTQKGILEELKEIKKLLRP